MFNLFTAITLGIGLSMDSLALSISCGLKNNPEKLKTALKVALIFSITQAVTPIIGYLSGSLFANYIQTYDHWVAFFLLAIIGGNMVREGLKHRKNPEKINDRKLTIWILFTMGIATSIDALAVGVSLAFIPVNLVLTIAVIFIITFLLSITGYLLGEKIGKIFRSRAEILGGLVLIALGLEILVEGLIFG